jgi:phosphate/sulfate permease
MHSTIIDCITHRPPPPQTPLSAASLPGAGVADKLQHGVTSLDDPECFACGFCDSRMSLYSLGMLSALFAAAVFLFLATARKLPVSTTHAIVGGIVGITIAANRDVSGMLGGMLHGTQCVDWSLQGFGGMVVSWVVSPLLAGGLSCLLYTTTLRLIYRSPADPEFIELTTQSQSVSTSSSISNSISSKGAAGNQEVHKPSSSAADDDEDRQATARTLRLLPVCYSGMTWTMAYLICSKSAATQVRLS